MAQVASTVKVETTQISTQPEVEPIQELLADAFIRDPKFIAAVLVGTIAVVLFYLLRSSGAKSASASRKRNGPPTVLLVGPCDGGKTAIFSKLVYGQTTPTHTSLKPSLTTISIKSLEDDTSKTIKIGDIPGHPRLKEGLAEQLSTADAVVFVVDVSTLIRNGPQVVEALPPVLAQLAASSINTTHRIPRLLILAHKADLLSRGISSNPLSTSTTPSPIIDEKTRSLALDRAKTILTREMERLKSARGTIEGKIEGISAVPTGSGSKGFFSFLFGSSGSRSSTTTKPLVLSEEGMEEAEMMIWGRAGPFVWEEVEGVEIDWAVSGLPELQSGQNARGVEKTSEMNRTDGLQEARDWILGL